MGVSLGDYGQYRMWCCEVGRKRRRFCLGEGYNLMPFGTDFRRGFCSRVELGGRFVPGATVPETGCMFLSRVRRP